MRGLVCRKKAVTTSNPKNIRLVKRREEAL